MISKDFALFSTKRTVFINEEPDRFNPYLLKLAKAQAEEEKKAAKPVAAAPQKSKPAFDVKSVSSDGSSDDDCIMIIPQKK